jgi:predicted type IV restriction endonuclease
MPNARSRIIDLVGTFHRNLEAYHSQHYNEAQLRREFIDPFFEELGWDVTNKGGYAPQYRDVIHEDAISIGGATKAPDYCFRIGGVRKFFLEAKKPSVNIDTDPDPAYQLRRYAWSAKLPLSILTNFDAFAVYDCQTRPEHTDRPSTARIMYLTYKQYTGKWSTIADIFSKDAILKGPFDKFAASTKAKRGTTTVDAAFLAEIESWRRILALIIALRNRSLSIQELNFAVQQTIDRILFLRMCEDRGIEPCGQLQALISGNRIYPRLCEIFQKADQRYNSGLFHFEDERGRTEPPDKLTLNLIIDDDKLKWILGGLYYPRSPYEFSVFPPEILGNVYEQFLGKVITLTSAHRAKVEEKPEVKKAGGVYYTPAYIVDYIVKNTVGTLLGDNQSSPTFSPQACPGRLTPKQIANLKILDPACGSGSFLLGAYTYLLNYHLDWYTNNDPETWAKKKNPPIYQVTSGNSSTPVFSRRRNGDAIFSPAIHCGVYKLTASEKKRILLNNIFGVDIDPQAVEVTKLSLLLKVLEGENQHTLENQYRLFHERALPDLANNIKCGNSLIGPDFFDSLVIPSEAEESRHCPRNLSRAYLS